MDLERDPLLSALRRVPDQDPPQDLAAAVLARIVPHRPSVAARLAGLLFSSRCETFRPLAAAAACGLVLVVFGLGFWLGRGATFSPVPDPGAEARFHLGRSLLAADRPEQALPYLEAAARQAPGNAVYRRWRDVAHAALDRDGQVRAACSAPAPAGPGPGDPDLARGCASLEAGRFAEALAFFETVLARDPDCGEALYHRALALNRLGRGQDEARAWARYLAAWPTGAGAAQAAAQLNGLGDFSYSAHQLGARTLVLRRVDFAPDGQPGPDSANSLARVAEVLARNPSLVLHVVAYAQGDAGLAEGRARAVREQLLRLAPGVSPGRIALSWFGVPETVAVSGTEHFLGQSVRFIGLPDTIARKGVKA